MKKYAFLSVVFLVLVMFALPAAGRVWKSKSGSFSLDAEFVSADAEKVTLKDTQGKTRTVQISQLSDADQAFIKSQQKPASGGKAAAGEKTVAAGKTAKTDWPRFHGLRGEGNIFAEEKGLLKAWPEGGPKLLWEVDGLGRGYASVTLSGDLLFTAGSADGRAVVQARKISDGSLVWKTDAGEDWTGHFEHVRSTPTVDADRVYYLAPKGDLACMNVKDGKIVWQRNILKDFEGGLSTWAMAESPLVEGNTLICTPGGKKGMIVGLNKLTGKTAWVSDPAEHNAAYSSLVPLTVGKLNMLLTFSEKEFLAYDADTGKKLFAYPRETNYGVNATDAVYHDGMIFLTSGYGMESEMVKLTVKGKTASVEKVWGTREMDNQHGGVVRVGENIYSACQNHNGGAWVCLDWKTGEKRWADRTIQRGSVAYADGMLFLWGEKNQMGLAVADPKACNVTGNFRVPEGGDGNSWAHPLVSDGKLYLRHADKLFVYQVK